jgi:hypothetical protein
MSVHLVVLEVLELASIDVAMIFVELPSIFLVVELPDLQDLVTLHYCDLIHYSDSSLSSFDMKAV